MTVEQIAALEAELAIMQADGASAVELQPLELAIANAQAVLNPPPVDVIPPGPLAV